MTDAVVPFPIERARPPAAETRLAQALDQLATALVQQRAAIGAWREALQDLTGANQKLETNLSCCTDELGQLASDVERLDAAGPRRGALRD
jgi:hypothetical protein